MISYSPLWKTLIDKKISKAQFRIACNIPKQTYANMNRDCYVSMQTIEKICNYLHCNIEDVIQIIH